MNLYNLIEAIQKTDLYTPLDDLQHLHSIILKSRCKIENTLFQEYCSFKDNKEYQIFKNEKYLDRQKIILDNIYLQYQQKEEKYKYPVNLTALQNDINSFQSQKKSSLVKIKNNRNSINQKLCILVTLDEHKTILQKQLAEIIFQINYMVCNWDTDLIDVSNKYQIYERKIKYHLDLFKFFYTQKQNQYFLDLQSLLIQELNLNNKYKNLEKETQEKIKKLRNSDKLEKENLCLILHFEKDIFNTSIQNYKDKLNKYQDAYLTLNQDYSKQKQNIDEQLIKNSKQEENEKTLMYDEMEKKVKYMQNLEWKLSALELRKKNIYNSLEILETDIQIATHQNNLLDEKIYKLELEKNRITPGIIRKYHFYMNFYHNDIRETKIKINVILNTLKKIKSKKFDMLDKTKLTRQKINILKKLQINIIQKIDEHKTRN